MTSTAVLTTSSIPMTAEIMPANNQNSIFSFTLKTATSDSIESYIEDFNNLKRATGQALIKMACMIFHVERVKTNYEKEVFAHNCGLNRESSTYEKWKLLGQRAHRFESIEPGKLPKQWTTLYALSKLNADKFDLVAQYLSPDTTMADINKMIDPDSQKKEASEKLTVTLQISTLNDQTLKVLREVCKFFDSDLAFSKAFKVEHSEAVAEALKAAA